MKSSRRTLFAVLGAAVLIAAAGFYFTPRAAPTAIRIGIAPFQDTVLPVVGDKLGWYRDAGYQVEFVDVGWTEVSLGLASNSFDVVLYPFDSMEASWPALKS